MPNKPFEAPRIKRRLELIPVVQNMLVSGKYPAGPANYSTLRDEIDIYIRALLSDRQFKSYFNRFISRTRSKSSFIGNRTLEKVLLKNSPARNLTWNLLIIFLFIHHQDLTEKNDSGDIKLKKLSDLEKRDCIRGFDRFRTDLLSQERVPIHKIEGDWDMVIKTPRGFKIAPVQITFFQANKEFHLKYLEAVHEEEISGTAKYLFNDHETEELIVEFNNKGFVITARIILDLNWLQANDIILFGSSTVKYNKNKSLLVAPLVMKKTTFKDGFDGQKVISLKNWNPDLQNDELNQQVFTFLSHRAPFAVPVPKYSDNNGFSEFLETEKIRNDRSQGPHLNHRDFDKLSRILKGKWFSFSRVSTEHTLVSHYNWEFNPIKSIRQISIKRIKGEGQFKGYAQIEGDHIYLTSWDGDRFRHSIVDVPKLSNSDFQSFRSIGLSIHGKEVIAFREIFVRGIDKGFDQGIIPEFFSKSMDLDVEDFSQIPDHIIPQEDKILLIRRDRATLNFPLLTDDKSIPTTQFRRLKESLKFAGKIFLLYSPYYYDPEDKNQLFRVIMEVGTLGKATISMKYPHDDNTNEYRGWPLFKDGTLLFSFFNENRQQVQLLLHAPKRSNTGSFVLYGTLLGVDRDGLPFSDSCFLIENHQDTLELQKNELEPGVIKYDDPEGLALSTLLRERFKDDTISFEDLSTHYGKYQSIRYGNKQT